MKHARTKRAKVFVRRLDANIEAIVIDDGKAFDVSVTKTPCADGGLSLYRIRERLISSGDNSTSHLFLGMGPRQESWCLSVRCLLKADKVPMSTITNRTKGRVRQSRGGGRYVWCSQTIIK